MSTEIVLLHVVAKRSKTHAQEIYGLDLHAAGTQERLRDVVALDLRDVGFEVEARVGEGLRRLRARGAGSLAANPGRQAVDEDRRRRFQGDRPLDDVLELAD